MINGPTRMRHPACTPVRPTNPVEDHEDGWLGQVPPPAPTPPADVHPPEPTPLPGETDPLIWDPTNPPLYG